MGSMRWVLRIFGIIVLVVAGILLWWVLVGYVNPGTEGATERKDVVQAFVLIVAGVVGAIGGVVGLANLQTSRRNLQQQRELEEQRAQEDSLQAYFEQMGGLLTDKDLINTDREEVRQLAQAQSHTVLARLDGPRKGALLRFLHQANLISTHKTIVGLSGADLHGADLSGADLQQANLSRANLDGANFSGANLRGADLSSAHLQSADYSGPDLQPADFRGANLNEADLSEALLTHADLREARLREANLSGAYLQAANLRRAKFTTVKQLKEIQLSPGATMPNGQKYEDWIEMRSN
jgi:uncharacterized protein YjbI with pentapeptide repeats